MALKVRVRVCFALMLLLTAVIWGGLFLSSPDSQQRMIFSDSVSAYFSDYQLPRGFVAPIRDMYCPAPNVWTRGNASPMSALEILRPFAADRGGAIMFMVFSALFFCGTLMLFLIGKVKMGLSLAGLVLASLCSSWIFMRTIERGNCIFVAAGLCVLFVSWFDSRRLPLRIMAAVALGLATSIKISPVFFGLLYFAEPVRKNRGLLNYDLMDMLISGVVAVSLLIVPFFFGGDFCGDFSAWMANINREAATHMSTWGLHGIVYYGSGFVSRFAPWIEISVCKWITVVLGLLILVAFLGMMVVRDVATRSDRLFFVVAVMLVLCTNSMFYMGIMLFPGLVLWLKEVEGRKRVSLCEFCQLALWLLMLMPLQIVVGGKTATMFITFFAFWTLILLRLGVCANRFAQCMKSDRRT